MIDTLLTGIISDDEDVTISSLEIENIWLKLAGREKDASWANAYFYFSNAVFSSVQKDTLGTEMYLRTKGWKITLKKHVLKSILLAPSLGGVLYYLGYSQLPAILLPTLLPVLFDIENIELTKSEEEILLRIPLIEKNKKYKNAEEWYFNLPSALRKDINRLDFIDFIDKLVLAGYARKDEANKYLIHTKGTSRFKITIE